MNSIKIEKMSIEAINRIEPLWQKLNQHHSERSTYFKTHFAEMTFSRRVELMTGCTDAVFFVAVDETLNEKSHELVDAGYVLASLRDRTGEIDSLFVDSAYRGQDLGSRLMEAALIWLKEKGGQSIKVSIAEGNESALDFYRKFGFKERLVTMQIP